AALPEGAIVSDEGNTSGLFAAGATAGAPPHDWLCLTGGAIGQGLPVAVGAAVACPDRRVVALESDGSAMYTLQAWWTMAREGLDVTTILCNNRSYAVLNMELNRVGAEGAGPRARAMLDLSRPELDFVALANGTGRSRGGGAPASRGPRAGRRAACRRSGRCANSCGSSTRPSTSPRRRCPGPMSLARSSSRTWSRRSVWPRRYVPGCWSSTT